MTRSNSFNQFLSFDRAFFPVFAPGCAIRNLISGENRPISFARFEIRDAGISGNLPDLVYLFF